jgi:cell wall-associated NlpC family hydrolase
MFAQAFSSRTYCRPLLFLLLVLLAGCSSVQQSARHSFDERRAITLSANDRGHVVMMALGLLDTRYTYGGSHPGAGFDCSGLVAYVFDQAANQVLPHNTAAIAQVSKPIAARQLQAGDFVFFNTLNRPFSHMGIYIGNDEFINAPSSGGRVRIDSLNNPYFAKRFESARTLFRN